MNDDIEKLIYNYIEAQNKLNTEVKEFMKWTNISLQEILRTVVVLNNRVVDIENSRKKH